jgi:hypothetical protein
MRMTSTFVAAISYQFRRLLIGSSDANEPWPSHWTGFKRAKARRGDAPDVIASCAGFDSTCTFELTRGVAGNIVTVHAGFTHINALTELPCIKLNVSLGDARTLLIRVLDLSRTRC